MEIIKKIENAVHALVLQYSLPEQMEASLVEICVDGVRGNSDLCQDLTDHPHAEDNLRYYVMRTALLKRIFFVDTPLGKLKVWAKHSTDTPEDFPGVFVDLVTPAHPEGDMLACVEYNSCDDILQTCVYQPNDDTPEAVIVHDRQVLSRIKTDEKGNLHYYDKNGAEILHGMMIRWDCGIKQDVYRREDGQLGLDATNPALIEIGKAQPCQYGIIPLTEDDLAELEVI